MIPGMPDPEMNEEVFQDLQDLSNLRVVLYTERG
jgi:hypothetical protein